MLRAGLAAQVQGRRVFLLSSSRFAGYTLDTSGLGERSPSHSPPRLILMLAIHKQRSG